MRQQSVVVKRVVAIVLAMLLCLQMGSFHVNEVRGNDISASENIYIRTAAELQAMSSGAQSRNRQYILSNDIYLVNEWIPIYNFQGIFDGRGHTINNLFVSEIRNRQVAGLFSWTTGATIKNLTIHIGTLGVNARHATASAGGLIGGALNTKIENVHITGRVSAIHDGSNTWGSISAGGIVGAIVGGTIEESSVSGEIFTNSIMGYGSATAGGLAGSANGIAFETSISNVYTSGDVVSIIRRDDMHDIVIAGGLIGYANSISIKNSYSLSDISARVNWRTGLICETFVVFADGLIGRDIWLVSASALHVVSTQTVQAGTQIRVRPRRGSVLTPEQMRNQNSFPNWDFDEIWMFREGVNDGFPVLRANNAVEYQPNPPPVETSISLRNTLTTLSRETEITGNFTSDNHQLRPNDDFIQWSVCTPGAVTFGGMWILNAAPGFVPHTSMTKYITPHLEGEFTITATSEDGASAQMTLTVIWTKETVQEYGAEFVRQHGTRLFRPIIDGVTYYVYEVQGHIRYEHDIRGFIVEEDSTRPRLYLLSRNDGKFQLELEPNILRKAGLVYIYNQVYVISNREHTIEELSRGVTQVRNLDANLDNILSQYNLLGVVHDVMDVLVTSLSVLTGKIYLAPFVMGSHFISIPAGSAASELIDSIVEQGGEIEVDARVYLNSMRNALRQEIERTYMQVIQGLQVHNLDNGFLRRYEDMAGLLKFNYSLRSRHSGYQGILALIIAYSTADQNARSALRLFFAGLPLPDVGFDGVLPKITVKLIAKDVENVTKMAFELMASADSFTVATQASIRDNYEAIMRIIYNPTMIGTFGNLSVIHPEIQTLLDYAQTIIISCPVDVHVYNEMGQLIGKVVDDIIIHSSGLDSNSPLIVMVEDATKVLIFPDGKNYRIELTASRIGTMNYLTFRTDREGNILSGSTIYNIELEQGTNFTINPYVGNIDYTSFFVGGEPHSILIDVTASTGGSVYAESSGFIKGDTVNLFAFPEAGYKFSGWYENNTRIPNAEKFFVFEALENRVLEARFVIQEQGNEITVNLNPTNGTVTPPNIQARVGSAYGTLPTPTRRNFFFAGWYTAPTEGERVTAESVVISTTNHTLYASWLPWGDVNGDGRVDSRDLELLQRHLNFGHLIQVQLDLRVADVLYDSRIDSLDLALLQRYLNFRHLIQIDLGLPPRP